MHRPEQIRCILILCLCAYGQLYKYLCAYTHPCAGACWCILLFVFISTETVLKHVALCSAGYPCVFV